jgi:hypothetical protein
LLVSDHSTEAIHKYNDFTDLPQGSIGFIKLGENNVVSPILHCISVIVFEFVMTLPALAADPRPLSKFGVPPFDEFGASLVPKKTLELLGHSTLSMPGLPARDNNAFLEN